MKKLVYPMAFASIIFVNGCSTTGQLSERDALVHHNAVATVQTEFDQADRATLSLLAQRNYAAAERALQDARRAAKNNDASAKNKAEAGKQLLRKAQQHVKVAKDVFAEVLEARQQAIASGAFDYAAAEMRALEGDFRDLALKLETGDVEGAKIRRPQMIRRYSALETKSLKGATVDDAKRMHEKARLYGAAKYAKKTFELADNELAIAVKLIEGDKSRKHEAEKHAKRAIELSEQAMGITDTVKEFRENNFSYEELVLWHQAQLQKAVKPLIADLKVNRPHHHIIGEINADIASLLTERQKSESQLQNQLISLEKDRKKREAQEAARRKKLDFIQTLFDEKEANVYLQKSDVLIRAQGFFFTVGESEIESKNFTLLQKIAKAVAQYPNATIVVTGHTDSTGKSQKNLALSRERAKKVAQFLHEFGGIDTRRIRYDGYGETKPVASNETAAGRAANRRVEILIQNRG